MDEIKQPEGDATPKGQDSPKVAESNSTETEETPRLIPESAHKKAIEDAIAQYGDRIKREKIDPIAKELADFKAQVQKEREEAEEEAVADDMPALVALRTKRQKEAEEKRKTTEITERESKLAARETELAEIIERDKVLRRTELAASVAVEKGVSIDGILKGVALAKDDSREAMGKIADLLPKANPKEPKIFDSGRNKGGGEDLSKLSDDERFNRAFAKMRGETK